ncbi:MAG: enoyl-CoA hydratase, partial [Burkholderiaceae bacterium]
MTANGSNEYSKESEPIVLISRDGPVATMTLNRPGQFNALSEAMLDSLTDQLNQLSKDESIRVVVLAASGKAFCAGHDLREMMSAPTADYYRELFRRCTRMMMTIQRMPQPVIARVQGVATAAGCQLVAMCDLAFAANHAKFAVSGVNLGLFCSTPSVPLSRNVSRKDAFEMLVTGRFISADEARDKGLVNGVCELDQLDAVIQDMASQICSKPAVAIKAGKQLFYRQLETGIEAAYQMAGETMACNMMASDTLEGVQAFLDKRPPDWKSGR